MPNIYLKIETAFHLKKGHEMLQKISLLVGKKPVTTKSCRNKSKVHFRGKEKD